MSEGYYFSVLCHVTSQVLLSTKYVDTVSTHSGCRGNRTRNFLGTKVFVYTVMLDLFLNNVSRHSTYLHNHFSPPFTSSKHAHIFFLISSKGYHTGEGRNQNARYRTCLRSPTIRTRPGSTNNTPITHLHLATRLVFAQERNVQTS